MSSPSILNTSERHRELETNTPPQGVGATESTESLQDDDDELDNSQDPNYKPGDSYKDVRSVYHEDRVRRRSQSKGTPDKNTPKRRRTSRRLESPPGSECEEADGNLTKRMSSQQHEARVEDSFGHATESDGRGTAIYTSVHWHIFSVGSEEEVRTETPNHEDTRMDVHGSQECHPPMQSATRQECRSAATSQQPERDQTGSPLPTNLPGPDLQQTHSEAVSDNDDTNCPDFTIIARGGGAVPVYVCILEAYAPALLKAANWNSESRDNFQFPLENFDIQSVRDFVKFIYKSHKPLPIDCSQMTESALYQLLQLGFKFLTESSEAEKLKRKFLDTVITKATLFKVFSAARAARDNEKEQIICECKRFVRKQGRHNLLRDQVFLRSMPEPFGEFLREVWTTDRDNTGT